MTDCPTGCNEESHLVMCYKCGAKYHFGLTHSCPTNPTHVENYQECVGGGAGDFDWIKRDD